MTDCAGCERLRGERDEARALQELYAKANDALVQSAKVADRDALKWQEEAYESREVKAKLTAAEAMVLAEYRRHCEVADRLAAAHGLLRSIVMPALRGLHTAATPKLGTMHTNMVQASNALSRIDAALAGKEPEGGYIECPKCGVPYPEDVGWNARHECAEGLLRRIVLHSDQAAVIDSILCEWDGVDVTKDGDFVLKDARLAGGPPGEERAEGYNDGEWVELPKTDGMLGPAEGLEGEEEG